MGGHATSAEVPAEGPSDSSDGHTLGGDRFSEWVKLAGQAGCETTATTVCSVQDHGAFRPVHRLQVPPRERAGPGALLLVHGEAEEPELDRVGVDSQPDPHALIVGRRFREGNGDVHPIATRKGCAANHGNRQVRHPWIIAADDRTPNRNALIYRCSRSRADADERSVCVWAMACADASETRLTYRRLRRSSVTACP